MTSVHRTDEEIAAAAELVARAMIDTKSYVEIFRGSTEYRVEALKYLFEKNLKMILSKTPESVYMYYSDENPQIMECSFSLVPSFAAKFTLWEKIFGGIIGFAFQYGLTPILRLIRAGDIHDAYTEDAAQMLKGDSRRYLSLQRMAVNPVFQGKGVGSKRLGQALREVADTHQLPVILGTQEPRNIAFYQRLYVSIFKY